MSRSIRQNFLKTEQSELQVRIPPKA